MILEAVTRRALLKMFQRIPIYRKKEAVPSREQEVTEIELSATGSKGATIKN